MRFFTSDLKLKYRFPAHVRSLVAFGMKQRSLGEAAKTQETSNFKNTVGSLKRLVGRTASDPEAIEVEKKFMNAQLVDVEGSVGAKVCNASYLAYSTETDTIPP